MDNIKLILDRVKSVREIMNESEKEKADNM